MAEDSMLIDQDTFICPVCLDPLKDPVTTPCGHNFCKECINRFWDEETQRGVHSCPQCRKTFTLRPDLQKNYMLADLVEKLNKTEFEAASSAYCYAGPGDVECDSCIGKKRKAVHSCLVCKASYCKEHLQPHYQSQTFKKHKLVEACGDLQEKICSKHDRAIDIFCRTDQSFICYLCMMDKHRHHETVLTKAEREEKQNDLQVEQIKSQQMLEEKQKKIQELKQTVDNIKKSSQAAVNENENIFIELISCMEKKRSELTELIRAQERAELSQAEQLLMQLEQEIADLKRRVAELEQLSQTHDHIHFLQRFPSLCVSLGCEDSPNITVNEQSFDGVKKSLSDLKKRVKEFCQEEFNKILPQALEVFPSESKNRGDFLQYFCYLTLDPNTVHCQLILSENKRFVKYSSLSQRYSRHPERFDQWPQVSCKERIRRRCYWEVEWTGSVSISVLYKEISRKGEDFECLFGYNRQSWSLLCSSSSISFRHKKIKTKLQVPAPSRIGVYVDHSAGTLSFYNVSDTLRLLHKIQTTFTQPLYAGFCVGKNSTVRVCDI